MKLRQRRKQVKFRPVVILNDVGGILDNMTSAQRTAYVTRLLRKFIRDKKRI